MTSTDWAAWVQAIGSIIAIGIAIAVPWWQTRVARQDQKEERDKRASALLLGLYPEIMEICYSISELRAKIDQHPPIRLRLRVRSSCGTQQFTAENPELLDCIPPPRRCATIFSQMWHCAFRRYSHGSLSTISTQYNTYDRCSNDGS